MHYRVYFGGRARQHHVSYGMDNINMCNVVVCFLVIGLDTHERLPAYYLSPSLNIVVLLLLMGALMRGDSIIHSQTRHLDAAPNGDGANDSSPPPTTRASPRQ